MCWEHIDNAAVEAVFLSSFLKHRHTVTLCCLFRKITMIPLMLSSFHFSDIFLGLLLMSVGETSLLYKGSQSQNALNYTYTN